MKEGAGKKIIQKEVIMQKTIFSLGFVFVLLVSLLPLHANQYEVFFKVMDRDGDCISIPITVKYRDGGDEVGTLNSKDCIDCNNFVIDLNGSAVPDFGIQLEVGTEYVIEFTFPGNIKKSLCYRRDSFECSGGTFDTYYDLTPTSCETRENSPPCEEFAYLYPDCSPIYPLAVSLAIIDEKYVGDKITFTLRATASGGDQNFSFSWSNAYPTTGSTTNPNIAKRTILSSQTVTVSVTVTSYGESVTRSKVLSGER